ncbi:receptor-type tyrosine-protein phosphatase S-like [Dendronephthya gigantea]|uniref:receptor-type tyrosine-protein phosphatase S-like n=1 Tax=Dendronephthya gigantea TaxID=151771 RepID=UPI00106DC54D|nr:receptor-type tyrosine-protein phosphatase S-like [Dendronephthya gigantea]
MVMGDKNQTKWSRSYSLKYSHDESLVDGSSGLQITGNLYSFQASTTDVDIYNVRYIKIHSTGNTDFCLRIELCGEVQSLAPVQNVVAKPSNFSVHLSWTIPSPEASTFITHFIIYLNGTEVKRISRAYYANQYILRELTPNTNYVVGIKTQDGQLKNTQTIVYHKFKTKEAVPSGAPRSVMIKSRSKNSLEISWRALDKIFWNGELVGYQICFSTKENDESPKCSNKSFPP